MHLVPGIAQGAYQKGLEQAVAAHHGHGQFATFPDQPDAKVTLVFHESLGRETLNGLRGGGQLLAGSLGQITERHGGIASRLFLVVPQNLEVILGAFGQLAYVHSPHRSSSYCFHEFQYVCF